MRVLSMFDGISCGRVALDRVGIMPEVYFASEIDEYAERVSADNWPDLVRLGDAKGVDGWDLGRIDLLLGGSPCTNWSITKKEGRELTASGTGWELFSFYVKALQKFEPKYFLYENVKSMSPTIREEITRALGVEPILINSGLVSAQNRERLYWTNIQGIGQPKDKGIALGDILEHGRAWIEKAYTLRASHGPHGGPSSVLRSIKTPGKFSFNGVAESAETGDRQAAAAYEVRSGYVTIKGERYPLELPDGNYRFRKLTKVESCRLQTLPDNYCKSVSDAQACKAVGNGWTVDIIAHILGHIPKGDCYTMKALVMTAQDAREFEKLGGLTITKPIKPAPRYIEGARFVEDAPGWIVVGENGLHLYPEDGVADRYTPPVRAGDIVFLREPWARLKNPANGEPSDRVILAADSTVAEGQTAYKWASPVSMPESAARRFAVVSKVEPIYNENVAVWSITLEAVTKATAEAGEAGALPYSDAPSPEEGSDYFTYAGDMSPEDHEHMIAAINQDRARLTEVQDRLIRIDNRRRELAYLNFEGRDKVDPNDRAALQEEDATLDAEQAELAREEADLRRSLEDAGAPSPTVEDHAREKLAAIRSRRAEIAAADPKDRVFEDLDGEEENLAAEERDLSAYLGAIDAAEDDPPGEEPPAGDGEKDPPAAQEDEEVGSFTLGKCNYCGREWGVTLEGAKGGGYPTQKTANAAATRVCDCPEAVENRKPEIGVAFAVTTGACRYCGQLQEVGPHPSQAAADETATEVCSCPSARTARRIAEQIEDAQSRVNRLFGEGAEDLGFKPIAGDGAIELLERVVELIARGPISSASLNIRGQCKAKFSITSKGKIKVSRSETRSCDLEAGE